MISLIMLQPRVRRSSIRIIADILKLLRLGEASKTEIICTINIGYYQAQNYLNRMLKLRLLDEVIGENRSPNYRVTDKGLKLLSEMENIQEMLRKEELPEVLRTPELTKTAPGQHPIGRS